MGFGTVNTSENNTKNYLEGNDFLKLPMLSRVSTNATTAPSMANLPVLNANTGFNTGQFSKTNLNPSELLSEKQGAWYDTQRNWYDTQTKSLTDYQNSFMGQAQPYIQGFSGIASGLGSLANIYTGFKQLGMMEDQLDIAKDQWAETKSELARVKGVRNKLNSSYMA
jgi:hypothetical protein